MAEKNEQGLLPAYLVTGADELKRETVVKRLRQRVAKEGDLEFNSDAFSGESDTGEAIVAACNTLPFASNVRLVLVTSVEKLKKPDQEELVQYLAEPCTTTVLCLVSAGLAKNTRLYKAAAKVGKQAVIDCTPPKHAELPAKVRAMATSHGVTITQAAANTLVELVGDNTVQLDSQLQKLALAHRGSDPINETEVLNMVSRTAEMKPWDFTDAFSERNLKKCLLVRSRMESMTPYALMAMCITRVRELMIARALLQRGRINDLPGVLHAPAWRVKRHAMWARSFTSEELHQALIGARDAEAAMKSGSDPELVFQNWVISVVERSAK